MIEKITQRPSKYPVNDGINYEGINFSTPVKQIDKLETQNVFGWENNGVIVHVLSRKKAGVPRITLFESGEKQHYRYLKRLTALLAITKHFCTMCFTGFTIQHILETYKKILQWGEWKADKN